MHNDAPIVASIVNLAKELGMGVIAEGVETHLQAERLIALECPHAQGFLFSPPLSVADTHAFLARQSAGSMGARPRVADPRSAPVVSPSTRH